MPKVRQVNSRFICLGVTAQSKDRLSHKTPHYHSKKKKFKKPLECIDLPVNCTGGKKSPVSLE